MGTAWKEGLERNAWLVPPGLQALPAWWWEGEGGIKRQRQLNDQALWPNQGLLR